MGNTKIEWTDYTWNPVTGCTKVSQGCKHCYAERLAPKVFAGQRVKVLAERDYPTFGEKKGDMIGMRDRRFTDVRCHPERLDGLVSARKPKRIFVNSMSDLFHEDVPDEFIDKVFAVMNRARQHTFQVLTKRPERMRDYLNDRAVEQRIAIAADSVPLCAITDLPRLPLQNVWLGVSVEDQATADERIPLLLQTPAAVRWISAEPLLGPVDLRVLHHEGITNIDALHGRHGVTLPLRGECAHLDWVVTGGESGPKARPMHPDWARSLRDQCAAAGVPFLFKQWGAYFEVARYSSWPKYADNVGRNARCFGSIDKGVCALVNADGTPLVHGGPEHKVYPISHLQRVGKKSAGRNLDGRIHDEYPA